MTERNKNTQPTSLSEADQEKIRDAVRLMHFQQMAGEGTAPSVFMHDDGGYVPMPNGAGLRGTGFSDEEKQEAHDRGVDHPLRTDVDVAISRAAMLGNAVGFNRGIEAARAALEAGTKPATFDLKRLGIKGVNND